jgi:hypothetical protein
MLHFFIYSTNIPSEYFKYAAHSPFFPLQNVVYFIMLPFSVVYYSHFIYRVCQYFKRKFRRQRVNTNHEILILHIQHNTDINKNYAFCLHEFLITWSAIMIWMSLKVKQYLYKPEQALRVAVGWGPELSIQSAHEGCKDVSPMHRSPLPHGNIPGNHFC